MTGNSSMIVAGLTAGALLTVGVLGYQAAANASATRSAALTGTAPTTLRADAREGSRSPTVPPRGSGEGLRVVYALDGDRVWLVEKNGTVGRAFTVSPSTTDPEPGTYHVTSRSRATIGSDGVPVEHVVRFATRDGTAIGFSAALDGSAPDLDPEVPTGGIRESRADGEAMWRFATVGREVVVVR